MKRLFALRPLTLSMALLPLGCASSIHQVHVSDFVPGHSRDSGAIIHAHGEQLVVAGWATDLDYVDQTLAQLLSKCPRGTISGITTETATKLGIFSWVNHLHLTGTCHQNGAR